ncbi:RNA pseudouridylate synthase [Entamoeba marina]
MQKKRSEHFEECSVLIENGIRYIQPYFHTYIVRAKDRWIGKQFNKYLLKNFIIRLINYSNDVIHNIIHKHELPIQAHLPIIYEDNNVIVVNKPSGTPTHPGGKYLHNSASLFLKKEYGYQLFVVHRLDRLTSGVLIFAKSSIIANEIQQSLKKAHKTYICRVIGDVDNCIIDKPLIEPSSTTLDIVKVDSNGLQSKTIIEKIFYDEESNTSVIYAKPLTGRMHQIRAHLEYIKHPIANDSMYRKNVNLKIIFFTDCNDCLNGIEIPYEELWLHAIEYTIEYDKQEKTFRAEQPEWSKPEFKVCEYLKQWEMNHK